MVADSEQHSRDSPDETPSALPRLHRAALYRARVAVDPKHSAPNPPPGFARALEAVRQLTYRAEFLVREAPAPARLAPFGFAQTVEVEHGPDRDVIATGRLVILHDPVGQASWEGTTRVVAYVDADVELEVAADPVLTDVGWAWLNEALDDSEADAHALGGTVTQVSSRSYGVMDTRPAEGRIQVRASWTPSDPDDLAAHARAWALLTASACGLSPASPGVASMMRRL